MVTIKVRFRIAPILCVCVLVASSLGKKCPGVCTKKIKLCNQKGGRILGYCNEDMACCDLSYKFRAQCGDIKHAGEESVTFYSPNYPKLSSGMLNCPFTFVLPIIRDYHGVLIEFEDVISEGIGFNLRSACETDMIYLRGFPYWTPPPFCGIIRNYATVIDRKNLKSMKNVTISAIMNSKSYRWKIRVSILQRGQNGANLKGRDSDNEISTATDDHDNPSEVIDGISWDDEDNYDMLAQALVVNGEDTEPSRVPWQVSLRMFPSSGKTGNDNSSPEEKIKNSTETKNDSCIYEGSHFCGGSIIADQFILSAAHCFFPLSKKLGYMPTGVIRVIVGDKDLCLDEETQYSNSTQHVHVEKVILHFAFDAGTVMNDIVLLKLKSSIQFGPHAQPVKLPQSDETFEEKRVLVSGWGLTNLTVQKKQPSEILQSAGMMVEDKGICDKYARRQLVGFPKKVELDLYPKYRTFLKSLVCTKTNSSSLSKLVGEGDSGGPLVYIPTEGNMEAIQVGVVSYGLPALTKNHSHDNEFVDFFQSVPFFRNWIDAALLV